MGTRGLASMGSSPSPYPQPLPHQGGRGLMIKAVSTRRRLSQSMPRDTLCLARRNQPSAHEPTPLQA